MNTYRFTLEQKDKYGKVRTRITEVKTSGNVYSALRLVQKDKAYKGYTLSKAEVLKDDKYEELTNNQNTNDTEEK